MRFSALVVVGDGNGRVGLGMGKAAEVPEAIEKATQFAKRNLVTVSLKGNTIPHATTGKFGRGQVLLLPAEEGTGVIAGGASVWCSKPRREDIRTKSLGSTTPSTAQKQRLKDL